MNSSEQKTNKRRRKLLKIFSLSFLGFITLVLIVAVLFAKHKAKLGLPDYSEDIELKNISQPVEVIRDQYGTPHIYAQNQEDLYRTVGYVMAQDRLWQMDLLRRVTLGRLSEIFGDDFVDTDLLLRSLRYTKKSKEILKTIDPEILSALEAYCDGVNQYIWQNEGNYPLEFLLLKSKPEKWEPYHSLNLIGYMAWDLKAGWSQLVLDKLKNELDSNLYVQLLPELAKYKTTIFPEYKTDLLSENKLLNLAKLEKLGADILFGSNNWAVSAQKSNTGKPIVANDMHLSLNIPGIWMQMHQVVEGELNVSGLALPGQPMLIIGHNDSIAWGMTNTYVDNLDYYEEKINPVDSNQYEYMGEWYNFELFNEEIKSSSDSVFIRTFRINHRGPVVSEAKGIKDKVLTIHWVGDEPSNEIAGIYKINRAHNWEDFKNAFRSFKSISQNVVYADLNGNIGLYACAGIPIRKRNEAFEILPGWTDEYDWKGMVPFEELPHEYNPERGYVSSANCRTVDDSYPYHIGSWYSMPYRMERIRERLEEKDKLSVEDFKSIQNDQVSTLANRLVEKFYSLLDLSELSNTEKEVAELLQSWNGDMNKELIEPSVSETFIKFFIKNVFSDEMTEDSYELFNANSKLTRIALYNILESDFSPWIDDISTPETENLTDIVHACFTETITYLEGQFRSKPQQWKWKNMHTITLKHPLTSVEILDKLFNMNRGPYGVGGSYHTVSPYSYPNFSPEAVEHGSSHRHIYSLADWDATQSVIPTGNSGVVSSEFYCDQTELYIGGRYHADFFSKEAVEKAAKYHVMVKPAN
ncbi:MAG: penicillin acylase family protein [Bacteroidales bacterium]|nr:penicillin acylase family protein [Bacteroidales bacterium]MBN2819040.1 penicillin acylase family protein [Bacteroidales bacterium]